MARLGRVLAELLSAADARRSADKPSGALRAVSGYLIGFTILSTAANAWAYFSVLRGVLSRDDAYGSAIMSTMIACAPLIAGMALSKGSVDISHRLTLLPVDRPTRMAIAALGPVTVELPIMALASMLPAVAALPIAAFSVADYALTVIGSVIVSGAIALAARSFAVASILTVTKRRQANGGHGRAIASAIAFALIAASNPRTVIVEGSAALAVFGPRLLPVSLVERLVERRVSLLHVALAAVCSIALALAAAVLEDAARRRASTKSPSRRLGWRAPIAAGALSAMMAVVDKDRSFAPSAAVAAAFGIVAVAQGASPAIPLVAALAIFAVRIGSALGFIAVENDTTRRFALIPAKPGSVERSFIQAALVLAAAVAMPLFLAAAALALG